MSAIRDFLFRAARTGGVRKVRRTAGRFGAPGLNPEFEAMRRDLAEAKARFDRHMPPVLNAIASTNGTARLLRREFDQRSEQVEEQIARVDEELARIEQLISAEATRLNGHLERLDGHVRDDVWPLIARTEGLEALEDTVRWLLKRVETVRAEMLHELRYGAPRKSADIDIEIVNPAALERPGGIRLNLGCGHLPLDGYVNVDMRKLPGVDVVAALDAMPFDAETIREIFSAHVLEHFPQAALERQLLPYWYSLLSPGGVIRSVVPDVAAMIDQYRDGAITFENLREVVYGGQEYEGDFHHTAFTPDSLSSLLVKAGFGEVELIERGRVNGACLEFELTARRPD